MNDTETIVGGAALDELLQTLAPKVEKNIVRSALRAGAKVFLEEAQRQVPQESGALAQSLRVTTRARGGQVTASVKAGNSIAYYADMVEFGTRPHTIVAKPGHALNVNGTDVQHVLHPGTAPHPFMRPAAEASFAAAISAVQAKVRQRLTKEGLDVPEAVPAGEREE